MVNRQLLVVAYVGTVLFPSFFKCQTVCFKNIFAVLSRYYCFKLLFFLLFLYSLAVENYTMSEFDKVLFKACERHLNTRIIQPHAMFSCYCCTHVILHKNSSH